MYKTENENLSILKASKLLLKVQDKRQALYCIKEHQMLRVPVNKWMVQKCFGHSFCLPKLMVS